MDTIFKLKAWTDKTNYMCCTICTVRDKILYNLDLSDICVSSIAYNVKLTCLFDLRCGKQQTTVEQQYIAHKEHQFVANNIIVLTM